MTATASDRFTILKAQAGDRKALEELLVAVEQPLYGYLVRLVGDAHTAEDLLQDVFLVMCRKLRWLRDPDLLRPWAFRIASRTAFRWLRRHRRLNEEPLDAAAGIAAEEPGAIDPGLLAQIGALSAASRAVITLHFLEDLPLADVSSILEIPLGTVKSRLSYGLAQLKTRMGVAR